MLVTQPLLREQIRLERRHLQSPEPRTKSDPLRPTILPQTPQPDLRNAERQLFQLEESGYKVADPDWDLEEEASSPETARTRAAEQVLREAFGSPARPGPLSVARSLQQIESGAAPAHRPALRSLQLLAS